MEEQKKEKIRLTFYEVDGKKVAMRKNGVAFTKKANINRFFYPEEYMKFEDQLKEKQKHTMRCLINTGARIMELQNLKAADVDYNNRRLTLKVTKTKAAKGETSGKPRTIPISSQFAKYLKTYAQNKGMLDKNGNVIKNDYFDIHKNGSINEFMKRAARDAKIQDPQDFSAHTLRKTLEVWLMSLGVQDLALTAHLGHDIRTAASHYVSPNVFNWNERAMMRQIIGDLYQEDKR